MVMTQHYRFVIGAVHTGLAWYLPLTAIVLAMSGLFLLAAEFVNGSPTDTSIDLDAMQTRAGSDSETDVPGLMSPRWAWMHNTVVMEWSNSLEDGLHARLTSSAAGRLRVKIAPIWNPGSLQPEFIKSQWRRNTSDGRLENSNFNSMQTPLTQSTTADTPRHSTAASVAAAPDPRTTVFTATGEEQLADPNDPSEHWDTRWGLFEMAGAQRGHWKRVCPCPVSAIDNSAGDSK